MQRFQRVENPDLLVIAGEASGDEHAAALVAKLKKRNPSLRVAALGGSRLAAVETIMLEDLVAHSRVGIWEVLKHLGAFMRLINETVRWVEINRPREVLLVDFVGFNLEVAKRLYQKKLAGKAGGPVKLYFYISPQIWAWKALRRFKIAKWIDSMGAIFPFEPACYADTNLQVEFVGHPFVDAEYKSPFGYDPAGPMLLLPGSRRALVAKHLPILWAAFKLFEKTHPGAKAAACYASESLRRQMIKITGGQLTLYPAGAPVKARAAFCTAGTIALTIALAGIPGVVFYKTDPLTFFYGKQVYSGKYIGMPNILLKREVMKELLQDAVTPEQLAEQMGRLWNDASAAQTAAQTASELKQFLGTPSRRSSVEWVESGLS